MAPEQFYQYLMNYVLTYMANDIPYFDLWNENLTNPDSAQLPDYPAVLLEFYKIHWKTLGNRLQSTELTFALHLVTEMPEGTSNLENAQTRHNALSRLSLIGKLTARIQNLTSTPAGDFAAIERIGTIFDHNHNIYRNDIIEFKCYLKDTRLILPTVPITPPPDLDLTVAPLNS